VSSTNPEEEQVISIDMAKARSIFVLIIKKKDNLAVAFFHQNVSIVSVSPLLIRMFLKYPIQIFTFSPLVPQCASGDFD